MIWTATSSWTYRSHNQRWLAALQQPRGCWLDLLDTDTGALLGRSIHPNLDDAMAYADRMEAMLQ